MSLADQGPRRRPAAGGYARGEETRARIVAAALKVFGDEGYDGASTRRIAEEAGVKPAALQYYFDSKEGLHRACAEHVLAHAAGLSEVMRTAAEAVDGPREAAIAAFCDLLDAIVDVSLDKKTDPGRARFMSRVQADGAGPALEVLRKVLVRPLQDLCVRLVAKALGREPGDPRVRLRAALLLSQVSAVHAARDNTLLLVGWSDFGGERRQAVKEALRVNTMAALGS
jgi:AcrR family transcriptional regulator